MSSTSSSRSCCSVIAPSVGRNAQSSRPPACGVGARTHLLGYSNPPVQRFDNPVAMDVGLRVLGSEVVNFEPASRGYTHQRRGLATLADGRRVFVKQAVDDTTTGWLQAE